MGAYHQMGHDSANLLDEPHLAAYAGAVLSPVNYDESQIRQLINATRDRTTFETVFDPQLYYPNSQRGHLRGWDYFPTDVDTADPGDDGWWDGVAQDVAATCSRIGPNAACSPAVVARAFPDEYYGRLVYAGDRFCECLAGTGVVPIQTAIASLADLSQPGRSLAVASILSRARAERVYLVLVGSTSPRREINDPETLKGAMRMIAALERSGMRVLVAFCSSEVPLWKAAQASSCATGKYFNVRRFTRARFEEPNEGGGQLPYWFEESLLAFLGESDLGRTRRFAQLSEASLRNPFGQQILQRLDGRTGDAWLGLGWQQYMYWFADFERRLHGREVDIPALLSSAERKWIDLEDANILMEDRRNDGTWLRAWRRALLEYETH